MKKKYLTQYLDAKNVNHSIWWSDHYKIEKRNDNHYLLGLKLENDEVHMVIDISNQDHINRNDIIDIINGNRKHDYDLYFFLDLNSKLKAYTTDEVINLIKENK